MIITGHEYIFVIIWSMPVNYHDVLCGELMFTKGLVTLCALVLLSGLGLSSPLVPAGELALYTCGLL